jgi:ribonuclease P protein component
VKCFDQGSKHFTRNFILFGLLQPDRPSFKVGLTVSRKTGHAVTRNRVKRVLREFFRLHQDKVDLPLDIVVVPKRNLDPKSLNLALATDELLPALKHLQRKAAESSAERT